MVILGLLVIVKAAQHEERPAKTAVLIIILQRFALNQRTHKPEPRVNNVEDITSEAATIGTSLTVDEQVNQIDNMLKT